jgi:putative tricarboxylic transport membrane protein
MDDEGATAPAARRWHVVGFALLSAIGVYAVVVSLRLGLFRQGSPGEGLFPFLTAAAMTTFGLVSLFEAWRMPVDPAIADDDPDAIGRFWRVGSYLAGLVFYAVTLDPLGFIVATIVTVVFIVRYAERYGWRTTVALAVGTAVACHILFVTWLGALLPTGYVWDGLLY